MSKSTVAFACIVIGIAVAFLTLFATIAGKQEFEAEHLFRTYPGLIVAMASGFFGATFSMLLQSRNRALQGTLEDLNAASGWTALTVRGAVGLGAAAILYFFSEVVYSTEPCGQTSTNSPSTCWGSEGGKVIRTSVVANEDWCLLIIWCFLAGFSENSRPKHLGPDRNEKSSYAGRLGLVKCAPRSHCRHSPNTSAASLVEQQMVALRIGAQRAAVTEPERKVVDPGAQDGAVQLAVEQQRRRQSGRGDRGPARNQLDQAVVGANAQVPQDQRILGEPLGFLGIEPGPAAATQLHSKPGQSKRA